MCVRDVGLGASVVPPISFPSALLARGLAEIPRNDVITPKPYSGCRYDVGAPCQPTVGSDDDDEYSSVVDVERVG